MGRPESTIFADLVTLCCSPGYIHAIAFFCVRDNLVLYRDTLTPEDMGRVMSPERLSRTEISTLIGLILKADIDFARPDAATMQRYVEQSQVLLEEMHMALAAPWVPDFDPVKASDPTFKPFGGAGAMREPIFYGGESAYGFQYADLALRKYRPDNLWLTANMGFTIDDACAVVVVIESLSNELLTEQVQQQRHLPLLERMLLPGFALTDGAVAARAKMSESLVARILESFTAAAAERNATFSTISDFNVANAQPLIRTPDGRFLLLQSYSLAESLYESPYYWMLPDLPYRPTASKHRGEFAEAFSLERLKRVFGMGRVFANVTFSKTKKGESGEIDVLVLFGDRAIVLQAKAKRLTLEARKGNDKVLRGDFKQSVEDAYAQALDCSKALLDPDNVFVDAQGNTLAIPVLTEIYPLCVVSDHYPALSVQARHFLKYEITPVIKAPFVMDVFTLDAITEMLDSPLYCLSYIARRVAYAEKLLSVQELTILSFHLKENLWFDDEFDMVMLGEDVSTDLDTAMAVRRAGLPGTATPTGILTRLAGTTLLQVIREIENKPDAVTLALGFTLLEIGEETFKEVSRNIDHMAAMALKDGQPHMTSAGYKDGTGLTVQCTDSPIDEAYRAIIAKCEQHHYAQKARKWFGLALRPLDRTLRLAVVVAKPWVYDATMEAAMTSANRKAASRALSTVRPERSISSSPVVRPGRNEPCHCGSGRKYKKCCLANDELS